MSLTSEFLEFLKKYQVIGLAVAVIIGAAATNLVNALVADIIMPFVGVLVPNGDWQASQLVVGPVRFLAGHFAGALINFVIIAAVVFFIVKFMMKEKDASKKV
jgi:large conductance mechanosensitive channel